MSGNHRATSSEQFKTHIELCILDEFEHLMAADYLDIRGTGGNGPRQFFSGSIGYIPDMPNRNIGAGLSHLQSTSVFRCVVRMLLFICGNRRGLACTNVNKCFAREIA